MESGRKQNKRENINHNANDNGNDYGELLHAYDGGRYYENNGGGGGGEERLVPSLHSHSRRRQEEEVGENSISNSFFDRAGGVGEYDTERELPVNSRNLELSFYESTSSSLDSYGTTSTALRTTTTTTTPANSTTVSNLVTGRPPICLYLSPDHDSFSSFQVLVRQNIEFFEALPEDVQASASGRSNAVVLGQVGLRCRFCARLYPAARPSGAVTYPSSRADIYQAAQNLVSGHWKGGGGNASGTTRAGEVQALHHHQQLACPMMPRKFRRELEARRRHYQQNRERHQQERSFSSPRDSLSDRTSRLCSSAGSTGGGASSVPALGARRLIHRRRGSRSLWSTRATALGIYEDIHGLRFAPRINAFGFPNDHDDDIGNHDDDNDDDNMIDNGGSIGGSTNNEHTFHFAADETM